MSRRAGLRSTAGTTLEVGVKGCGYALFYKMFLKKKITLETVKMEIIL